jgi:YVTN family beta-propeller protein
MKRKFCASLATSLLAVLVTRWAAPAAEAADLRLIGTIPMAGIEGRIDHLAATPDGRMLFVAALESGRVLRIDTAAGKVTAVITGVKEPQGVCYLREAAKLVVASGGDGTVRIYDGALKLSATANGLDDADNVRYDPGANLVYAGYGQGALAVIDPERGVEVGRMPLDGHPESFQLEDRGTRIFVNVPTAGEIEVVDRARRAVIAEWKVGGAADNFPMALDEADRRLFIGTRHPPRLLVIDTESGKTVATRDACGDTDDLFYDAPSRRIYLSGGEGCIDVFRRTGPFAYRRIERVKTPRGARTSLLMPAAHRLYLAAPHRNAQNAAVLVFQTGN